MCESYYSCGCEQRFPEHETVAECVKLVGDEMFHRLEQGIDRDLEYDPTCLDAHAELLEGMGCATATEVLLAPQLFGLAEEIDRCRTYHGTHDLQMECDPLATARGDDCSPGLRCHPDFATCVANEVLAEGDPCGEGGDFECGLDSYCAYRPTTNDQACAVLPTVGESCAVEFMCTIGSRCDQQSALCVPLAAAGEPCEGSGACDFESWCDAGTCVPRLTEGQPCVVGCALGLSCGEAGVCEQGRAVICDARDSLP